MPKSIAEVHPELFHYTGAEGLKGIIGSQTLWATHYSYMNDRQEITEFKPRLLDYLKPQIDAYIESMIATNPANRNLIDRNGGKDKILAEITPNLISGIFRAFLGEGQVPPFSEPYITSFSTTTDSNVAKHGLLSQWRSYGQDGGYAISFDTLGMDALLRAEAAEWGHDLIGGDVVYSNATDDELIGEFGDQLAVIRDGVLGILQGKTGGIAIENVYPALLMCACRYKHWGFHEEREVRVISALPASKDVLDQMNARGLKLKPRNYRTKSGTPVPYIELFREITNPPTRCLPIKRIIVGPHSSGANRRQAVELLLDQHKIRVEVTESAIPYIG